MQKARSFAPVERIEKSILVVRGQRVMLDRVLAGLYGIETKALKQAVRRNIDRFPSDFMFVPTYQELVNLRSQFVISNSEPWGKSLKMSMVFTVRGVAS